MHCLLACTLLMCDLLQAFIQSHGVQFFLGLFDTEVEAVFAYDSKLEQLRSLGATLSAGSPADGDRLVSSSSQPENVNSEFYSDSLEQSMAKGRLLWERLTCVYQRWLLARATRSRLSESQVTNPDYHKDAMVKSLNEEIVILGVAKAQLERAVCSFFAGELALHGPDFSPLSRAMQSVDSSLDLFPFASIFSTFEGAEDEPVTAPPVSSSGASASTVPPLPAAKRRKGAGRNER